MVTPLRKDGLKFHKIFGLEEDIFPRYDVRMEFLISRMAGEDYLSIGQRYFRRG